MGYLVLGLGNSTIFERKMSRSKEKQKLSLQACREPKEKKFLSGKEKKNYTQDSPK